MTRKSFVLRGIVALSLILGFGAEMGNASASAMDDASNRTHITTNAEDSEDVFRGPFNGRRFNGRDICIIVAGNANAWPISTAAHYFNTSKKVNIVVQPVNGAACAAYDPWQRITVIDYNYNDGYCARLTYYTEQKSNLPYRTYVYAPSHPILQLNRYNPNCSSTATKKGNNVSRNLGDLLGLAQFNDPSLPYSVMNQTSWSLNNIAWAQGYDRNGIYVRYP